MQCISFLKSLSWSKTELGLLFDCFFTLLTSPSLRKGILFVAKVHQPEVCFIWKFKLGKDVRKVFIQVEKQFLVCVKLAIRMKSLK